MQSVVNDTALSGNSVYLENRVHRSHGRDAPRFLIRRADGALQTASIKSLVNRQWSMAFAIMALFTASGICAANDRVVADRPLMGTSFRVIVEAENSERLQAAIDAAFAKAALIEAACSDYREDSEVSAFVGLDPADALMISPLFADVMQRALDLSKLTHNAYDPALGTLTILWRESVKTKRLPIKSALDNALAVSGSAYLKLDGDGQLPNILHVERFGLRIDLGGIAKGYAADAMHDILNDAGFACCAIIAGGDVRVGAPPEGKSGWKIGLRTMKRDVDDTTIILANAAVSTSGGLYQTVNIEGVNYSHILDPSSGLGLTEPIAASVIARTATISDALATAACVAGSERAVNEIATWGGTAVRVVTRENNAPKVAMSKGFATHVSDSKEPKHK